jgi:hypothetical protein
MEKVRMTIKEFRELPKSKKRSKFGAEKVDGYDSKKEKQRGSVLSLLEKQGIIKNLRRQVRYDLAPSFYVDGVCVHKALFYKADFVYIDETGEVVEDVKGCRTKEYIKKKNLMKRLKGINIKET